MGILLCLGSLPRFPKVGLLALSTARFREAELWLLSEGSSCFCPALSGTVTSETLQLHSYLAELRMC